MAMEKLFYGEIASGEVRKMQELVEELAGLVRDQNVLKAAQVMDQIEEKIGNVRTVFGECERVKGVLKVRGISSPGEVLVVEPLTIFSAPVQTGHNGSKEPAGFTLPEEGRKINSQKKERPRLPDLTDDQEKIARALFSITPGQNDFRIDRDIVEEVYAGELSGKENDLDRQYLRDSRVSSVHGARKSVANKLDVMSLKNYQKGRYPGMEALIEWIQSQPEFEGISLQIIAQVARKEISLSKLRALRNKEPESNGQDYTLTGVEKRFLAGRLSRLILNKGLFHESRDLLVAILGELENRQKRLHPEEVKIEDIEGLRKKLLALCNLINGSGKEQVLRENPNKDTQTLLDIFQRYVSISGLPEHAINELVVILPTKR